MNKLGAIIAEIQLVTAKISGMQLEEFASILLNGKRIFVVGEGRSGLMAKSFAMRLMHLGATVFVVGETITPSINEGDILVAVSGSGTTKGVVWVAEKAKSMNCQVVALTTNVESELASCASLVLHVPAATKFRKTGELKTIQPLGSLFDQCVHVLFDTICLHYADLKDVNHDQVFKQHSNME
ncbi:6-phospho-3-hexuloisomerase [Neobacillus sp. PS3-40]|uniref:6-phospho-3-hexuloisomerase n=1 Tax=Neobacillus sp. PS3-40 TaxID=3070679 RepID=UPI0027E0B243|nr:6-phospho-3-hexuloisomerase [Neobacillus sp. PS3-40]WML43157.1 6-phospho-3-hexuloisomerase [Neobacillus sp. PS3-40]